MKEDLECIIAVEEVVRGLIKKRNGHEFVEHVIKVVVQVHKKNKSADKIDVSDTQCT